MIQVYNIFTVHAFTRLSKPSYTQATGSAGFDTLFDSLDKPRRASINLPTKNKSYVGARIACCSTRDISNHDPPFLMDRWTSAMLPKRGLQYREHRYKISGKRKRCSWPAGRGRCEGIPSRNPSMKNSKIEQGQRRKEHQNHQAVELGSFDYAHLLDSASSLVFSGPLLPKLVEVRDCIG